MAELGLRLEEAKQLTAALQAEIVPAQMTALSEHARAYMACGRRLAAKGHYGARFRFLFGDVPAQVRRWFVCQCQCQGESEATSGGALRPRRRYSRPRACLRTSQAGMRP